MALVRCWQSDDEGYNRYHDEEWGRPVRDERGIYERLCLEGFQSGLSWLTILRKRPAFREAFAGFDPDLVAAFGEARRRRGCSATPGSCVTAGRSRRRSRTRGRRSRFARDGEPLHELFWSHAPGPRPAAGVARRLPAATPESVALAKRLRAAGFRFVGPTTVYAAMQACGVVNDHIR